MRPEDKRESRIMNSRAMDRVRRRNSTPAKVSVCYHGAASSRFMKCVTMKRNPIGERASDASEAITAS